MKKSQSFFSLFKSPKNSENEVESNKQVHKHYIASSKCNNSRNKSKMEREWTKACGQMDKRAQLLQVFCPFFYCILINVSVTYQDALKEAEKKQAEIKPINFFKAESRLNLRKPSIYPTPIEDDVSSLENCNSTSFFCINTLGHSFGSTKDLKPVRRDSLELESEADKSFKRKSKRKHFFRANSVDDSMFK